MALIEAVRGDITEQEVDAIVNAANPTLLGGGGVDGAIHAAGGPSILAECRTIRRESYPSGLPTGQAVVTAAGRLRARHVIHTVGPIWTPDEDRSALLRSAYRESMLAAKRLGLGSIAFPAISAGAYGWPIEDAARIGVGTVREEADGIELVRFVLANERAFAAFEAALAAR